MHEPVHMRRRWGNGELGKCQLLRPLETIQGLGAALLHAPSAPAGRHILKVHRISPLARTVAATGHLRGAAESIAEALFLLQASKGTSWPSGGRHATLESAETPSNMGRRALRGKRRLLQLKRHSTQTCCAQKTRSETGKEKRKRLKKLAESYAAMGEGGGCSHCGNGTHAGAGRQHAALGGHDSARGGGRPVGANDGGACGLARWSAEAIRRPAKRGGFRECLGDAPAQVAVYLFI